MMPHFGAASIKVDESVRSIHEQRGEFKTALGIEETVNAIRERKNAKKVLAQLDDRLTFTVRTDVMNMNGNPNPIEVVDVALEVDGKQLIEFTERPGVMGWSRHSTSPMTVDSLTLVLGWAMRKAKQAQDVLVKRGELDPQITPVDEGKKDKRWWQIF